MCVCVWSIYIDKSVKSLYLLTTRLFHKCLCTYYVVSHVNDHVYIYLHSSEWKEKGTINTVYTLKSRFFDAIFSYAHQNHFTMHKHILKARTIKLSNHLCLWHVHSMLCWASKPIIHHRLVSMMCATDYSFKALWTWTWTKLARIFRRFGKRSEKKESTMEFFFVFGFQFDSVHSKKKSY